MAEGKHPVTQGGQFLQRGFRDPECHRASYRHDLAMTLLRTAGVKPTYPEHLPKCILHPDNRSNRLHGWTYHCDNGCKVGTHPRPIWPEWATGDMFDHAYRLADEVQTERGQWHQAEAYKAKQEAEAARRAQREAQA